MIRLIQRRLIVPRGDTGTFSIPVLAGKDNGDASVFTIFDPLTHRKVFEKVMELSDGALTMDLTHGDTVNLPVGQYVWDIKFYTDAVFDEDGRVASGTEVDSYYAAFQLPICEIRETGDNLLLADDAPDARLAPDQINYLDLVRGQAEESAQNAANSAAEADTSATNAENSASAAAASLQAVQDIETSVLAAEQTASAAAVSAQESADLASQKAAQIEADLASKADKSEIPTLVSQLTNDAGYLTQHQDISMKANSADLAAVATSGDYNDLQNKPTIPEVPVQDVQVAGNSILQNGIANIPIASTNSSLQFLNGQLMVPPATATAIKGGANKLQPITPNNQHSAAFYGLAKAAGSDEKNSELPVGQYTNAAKAAIQQMLGVPSTSDIPTNVSDLTNDAGYLTEHQDISGKANVADLATVATSGSYNDLSNKPIIPDVQINGSSIVENGVANIPKATSSALGAVRSTIAYGITTTNNGEMAIALASSAAIKEGTEVFRPITPTRQHEAAFYGLAKAAGADEKNSAEAVGTYTAAAQTAIRTMLGAAAAADIPTNVSTLTNDAGYLTSYTETDPTVPSWAKAAQKPVYTAAEVGAVNKTGDTMTGTLTLPYISQSYRNALRFATNSNSFEMGINARYDGNYGYGYFKISAESTGGSTQDAIIRGVKTPRFDDDAANKGYVDSQISTAIGNINSFDMAVVQELPTQDISTHTIYLVPKTGETNDVYDEYVYINSAWEMVGNTQVDLSNYALKSELPTRVSELSNDAGYLTTHQDISGKVDTSALAAVATSGSYNDLSNKPTIPEVPVQDVQVAGTSVVENGVANVPIATRYNNGGNLGVVSIGQGLIIQSSGMLFTDYATITAAKNGANYYMPVTPVNQHASVFYGLAKAAGDTTQSQSNNTVGTYTETAKGAIQKMLGITDLIAPEENDLVADQAYAIGDIFTSGGKLYKATSAIAFGGTIVPTTNCVETNVIDEVAAKLDATEAGLKVVRLI